jgi:DNA-binding response OmpR family regulator
MKTILVVEDNTAIRKLFCTVLKKQGFETVDFSDGSSVIKEIENLKPDLMILDILLPDINGTDLIQKLRSYPNCANTPALAVTGFASEQDERHFKEIGFNDYLAKPIDTVKFTEVIKKLLY